MKSDIPYLDYIRDAIERIETFTAGGREEFMRSALVRDATLHNLQTLAESTKRLSAARKATEPEVPWARIAGFRDVLVHEYDAIDLERVWRVIVEYLPPLKVAVARMMAAGSMEPAAKERNRGDT